MTYDLAVWEGDQPADDVAGAAAFVQLYGKYIGADGNVSPTPRIAAYVEALLDRWVDMTEDDDASPWSDGPLINNASGPIIYFAMRYSMAEEVSAEAARMAVERGLVCFDVQWDRLRPAPEEQQAGPSTRP
ncbi:hypothetical protein ACFP2T_47895 [Plantactinospora solaniradicis]|uniref:Uncharacterized protein n=1 Tax=Plantactinospora solaniradicis TaxID=1723736 RepID=A0ABW1KQ31_9ACTN